MTDAVFITALDMKTLRDSPPLEYEGVWSAVGAEDQVSKSSSPRLNEPLPCRCDPTAREIFKVFWNWAFNDDLCPMTSRCSLTKSKMSSKKKILYPGMIIAVYTVLYLLCLTLMSGFVCLVIILPTSQPGYHDIASIWFIRILRYSLFLGVFVVNALH